jgi:hypothetical protein
MRIVESSVTEGKFTWDDDDETIRCDSFSLNLSQLRNFLQEELEMAAQALASAFFSESYADIPTFDIAHLKDSSDCRDRAFWFGKHSKSTGIHQHQQWLVRRILQSDDILSSLTNVSNGQREWTREGLAIFLERDKAFLESLAVLIHLTSGMPARMNELLPLLFENFDGRRNVFLRHDFLFLNFWFNKKSSHANCSESIQRFPPPPVAQLLIQYLALVIPFKRFILIKVGISWDIAATPLLWWKLDIRMSTTTDEARLVQWQSDKLISIFRARTEERLESSFGVAMWRHLATGIVRRFLIEVRH